MNCDRISCYVDLDKVAGADFIEEIRMKCASARNLDRKSGEANYVGMASVS